MAYSGMISNQGDVCSVKEFPYNAFMKLIYFLRSVRAGINWLALSALVVLLLKILVFDQLPALFPKAYELGQIADRLLVSILASYIVYLIVVHARECSNRQTVYPYVLSQSRMVV